MDIDIILEPDVTPQQVAELAVEAEKLGIRALWTSNYHQNWDAFLSLVPAAQATSKLLLGALAVSPWEMHPLKMANTLLTLNEMSNGRAMVALSGGGGVLGACGWKIHPDGPVWPIKDEVKGNRYPERRVTGVREGIEILQQARSGKMAYSYDGDIFCINRPYEMNWLTAETGPIIYGCCSGPMMLRMGGRVADGIQVSDFSAEMMGPAMENLQQGLAKRETPVEDFRIGNFWAWHIKKDRETSMYEARRELIWRGAIAAKYAEEIRVFCHDDAEVELVLENYMNFMKAFWTRTGVIDNIPEELSGRLIAGMASAGDFGDIDREVERYKQFPQSGLTELSLRLFDNPMDGLKMIGEHVVPAFR
jgi:5,10-methylenetetrahydromethanopterin reductase